ncbi:MAG TPA: DUF2188 domain-containing protein [Xanthobacteraceae bacterium]|jgi:hypothetical protein
MPRPLETNAPIAAILRTEPRRPYFVLRRQDRWFIAFGDEEFGPYQSEREALLFAIDAAHGLGEKGEETQVLALDERGSTQPVWTYGIDSYPPGL